MSRSIILESMEARTLCSWGSYDAATHVLTVVGTGVNDAATFALDNRGTVSRADDRLILRGHRGPAAVLESYTAIKVGLIKFYGLAGNDLFDNTTPIPSMAFGGAGNDTLKGGSSNDQLFGNAGTDQLFGRAGNDYLDTGADASFFETANGGAGAGDMRKIRPGDLIAGIEFNLP